MKTLDALLSDLRRTPMATGYWGERVLAECEYVRRLSAVDGGCWDGVVRSTLDFLAKESQSSLGKGRAEEAEALLGPAAASAKSLTLLCVAHAHIDMNWMWRFDETVAITHDTFRTMLDLMEEYPGFTFSQSQASVYHIIERHAPAMLDEIRRRVGEKRWEVAASTWVENDKNMPSGESMARHILYTKRTMKRLFNLEGADLPMDFEPDTFGHSAHLPEALSRGGVKYYYHCRGMESQTLYRWAAPSGAELLVYREPAWYNAAIQPDMVFGAPELCAKHGMDTMLKVYGVGDHGGGPTRRDLERILDMDTWPAFPKLRFGTYGEFFALAEKVREKLPRVEGELNFVFTGCYTSESRIKMANRMGEAILEEGELYNALSASVGGYAYDAADFASAWERVLFNQFHDIIPGSGVTDTREHAMGQFQEALATANTRRTLAVRDLASRIDTSALVPEAAGKDSRSEGAGVGYSVGAFRVSQLEQGRGGTRIFHVFNPSLHARKEVTELVAWDWSGDTERIEVVDSKGQPLAHQVVENRAHPYWGHDFMKILVEIPVPAGGYATCLVRERDDFDRRLPSPRDPRIEVEPAFVLDNGLMRAVFHPRTGALSSLRDLTTGEEWIDGTRHGGFRFILEDDGRGMTSWVVGRPMKTQDLVEEVRLKPVKGGPGDLASSIEMEIPFRSSRLKVVATLQRGERSLRFAMECDFREIGERGKGIPQLAFTLPLKKRPESFTYDTPFGTVDRKPLAMDVPANSFIAARDTEGAFMLTTDSKYGFRGEEGSLSVTLLRASYDPDPTPEVGQHRARFWLEPLASRTAQDLIRRAHDLSHPFTVVSGKPHRGTLPLDASLVSLDSGTVAISAVKMPEEGKSAFLLRVYETAGKETRASFSFRAKVASATRVDLNEHAEAGKVAWEGKTVNFDVGAFQVATLRVELAEKP